MQSWIRGRSDTRRAAVGQHDRGHQLEREFFAPAISTVPSSGVLR
jgi:hypothetical protein